MSNDGLYFPALSFDPDPRARARLAKAIPLLFGQLASAAAQTDRPSAPKRARFRDAKPLPAFRQTDITRAIRAVRKAGEAIVRTEVDRDGTIRIIHGVEAQTEAKAFDEWHAGRHAGPP